jgi:hypothetical protein
VVRGRYVDLLHPCVLATESSVLGMEVLKDYHSSESRTHLHLDLGFLRTGLTFGLTYCTIPFHLAMRVESFTDTESLLGRFLYPIRSSSCVLF